MNESSPLSSLSLFAHLVLFIPRRCGGRRSAANGLSDERDKWQRCFGSGDSELGERCVCVLACECVCLFVMGAEAGSGKMKD